MPNPLNTVRSVNVREFPPSPFRGNQDSLHDLYSPAAAAASRTDGRLHQDQRSTPRGNPTNGMQKRVDDMAVPDESEEVSEKAAGQSERDLMRFGGEPHLISVLLPQYATMKPTSLIDALAAMQYHRPASPFSTLRQPTNLNMWPESEGNAPHSAEIRTIAGYVESSSANGGDERIENPEVVSLEKHVEQALASAASMRSAVMQAAAQATVSPPISLQSGFRSSPMSSFSSQVRGQLPKKTAQRPSEHSIALRTIRAPTPTKQAPLLLESVSGIQDDRDRDEGGGVFGGLEGGVFFLQRPQHLSGLLSESDSTTRFSGFTRQSAQIAASNEILPSNVLSARLSPDYDPPSPAVHMSSSPRLTHEAPTRSSMSPNIIAKNRPSSRVRSRSASTGRPTVVSIPVHSAPARSAAALAATSISSPQQGPWNGRDNETNEMQLHGVGNRGSVTGRDVSPAPDIPGRGPDRVHGPAAALLMIHGPRLSPSPSCNPPSQAEALEPPSAILRIKRPGALPQGTLTSQMITARTGHGAHAAAPPPSGFPRHGSAQQLPQRQIGGVSERRPEERKDSASGGSRRVPPQQHAPPTLTGDIVFVDGGGGGGGLASEQLFSNGARRPPGSAPDTKAAGQQRTVSEPQKVCTFDFCHGLRLFSTHDTLLAAVWPSAAAPGILRSFRGTVSAAGQSCKPELDSQQSSGTAARAIVSDGR